MKSIVKSTFSVHQWIWEKSPFLMMITTTTTTNPAHPPPSVLPIEQILSLTLKNQIKSKETIKAKDKVVDYRLSWRVNSRKKGGRGRGQRVSRMLLRLRCAGRGGKSVRRARAGALVSARALAPTRARARALNLEVEMERQCKKRDKDKQKRERLGDGVMMARWV